MDARLLTLALVLSASAPGLASAASAAAPTPTDGPAEPAGSPTRTDEAAASATAESKASPAAREHARRAFETLRHVYLTGRWDRFREAADSLEKLLPHLPDDRRRDAAYIMEVAATARPPWWDVCALGAYTEFTATVWGRETVVQFSPGERRAVRISRGPGPVAQLTWDPTRMDSSEPASGMLGDAGFTAAEACEMTVWLLLGTADHVVHSDSAVLRARYRANKAAAQQAQSFRSCLATLYHAGPRGRLALTLTAADALAGGPRGDASARPPAALGAAIVRTILAEPSAWPSLAPGRAAPEADEDAERAAAEAIAARVGQTWTLPEDRALRALALRMAEANPAAALTSGLVVLPGGRRFAFDPNRDAALRDERSAWVRKRLKRIGN